MRKRSGGTVGGVAVVTSDVVIAAIFVALLLCQVAQQQDGIAARLEEGSYLVGTLSLLRRTGSRSILGVACV